MIEKRYQTPYGHITFEELHTRCHRYAAYLLRNRMGITNKNDLDDCLQVGFLKLWQRLEREPDFLADKTRYFVALHITLVSKVQRYSHLRHHKKIATYTGYTGIPHYVRSHDIDTRIDLTQAVENFANTEPDDMVLLAYYYLGTNVSAGEAAAVYNVNRKRVYNYTKHARTALIARLPNYRMG